MVTFGIAFVAFSEVFGEILSKASGHPGRNRIYLLPRSKASAYRRLLVCDRERQ